MTNLSQIYKFDFVLNSEIFKAHLLYNIPGFFSHILTKIRSNLYWNTALNYKVYLQYKLYYYTYFTT
jgi:hypothetical protein